MNRQPNSEDETEEGSDFVGLYRLQHGRMTGPTMVEVESSSDFRACA
jgi:hypothetical protein